MENTRQKSQGRNVISYLENLQYDPRLEKSIIAKYINNFRYVLLLIIIIVTLGITSYISLPRRLNPEVKIPIVSVTTVLPGAGPNDVEQLVTIPLEDNISNLANINTLTSVSQDNVSIISVEFKSGINPDKAKDNVQSQVDSTSDLAKDAQTPKVQKLDFENQPVWQFAITTTEDKASLINFTNNLKGSIEKLTSIKAVTLSGFEQQEIQVNIPQNIQTQYQISPLNLSQAIQAAIPSHPAGNIESNNSAFSLTLDPTVKSLEQLRALEIIVNGQPVKLGDIATISYRSKPNQPKTFLTSGNSPVKDAVVFNVTKNESANIDKAVKDIKTTVDSHIRTSNNQFELVSIIDTSKQVNDQFADLQGSFFDTIILVAITLFVFLGGRQALIVAASIPLTFFVAFTVMNAMGLTINFLTLFSLLLGLGLLVDDAIVVVTAVTAYWRIKKFTPKQTGLLVLRDFILPIWSTTITAVWAFVPLLLSTGIIGEFIKSIPIVVSTTLLASTAIAVLITLPTMVLFLSPQFPKRVKVLFALVAAVLLSLPVLAQSSKSYLFPFIIIVLLITWFLFIKTKGKIFESASKKLSRNKILNSILTRFKKYFENGVVDSQKIAKAYHNLIYRVISSKSARIKIIVTVTIFAFCAYLLLPLGLIVNEFFPKSDEDQVYVQVEYPPGTNLSQTEKKVLPIIEDLKKTEGTQAVLAEIGQQAPTGFTSFGVNSNNALFTLILKDKKERHVTSIEIAESLRNKYKNYPEGKLSVVEVSGGPPAGSDLQLQLSGDNLTTIDSYADKIQDYLKKEPGVTNVQKSIVSGTGKITFIPNKAKMATFGVNENQIGLTLRNFASGFSLDDNVKFDDESFDVVLRSSARSQELQNLTTLQITSPSGQTVPLSELGDFKLLPNPTQITREDQKRTITVSAAVTKGFTVSTINKKLEKYADSLNLPSGYAWKTGGVNEENQKSVTSILQAMVLAFMLIAGTMILQFGSYRKAFITLLLIPLAISGVFYIFALTGNPLSFPTLIGILALFGIVVYQGMMIVDKINRNLRFNMKLKDAIADAGASRVEPILFGTLTTVIGLIPITISNPLWRGLGGAIISGMIFSGVIMLLFIPVVYYSIFKED